MAGSFDFLHIKRRTAGSSNELSFDVLEHMSDEAVAKAKSGAKDPKPPKASQGSYGGVGGAPALTGQAEVERRKKARHASRVRLYAVVAIAVVTVVATGVMTGVRIYEDQKNVTGRVSDLVGRISVVDESMAEVDALMDDPLDGEGAERRSALANAMPQLTTELNRVSVDAQSLKSLPLDEKTEVVVGQLTRAAQARIAMLSAAANAFSYSVEATSQVARANTVWNDVLKADQASREAIAAANKATTQEATRAALEETRSALAGFNDALYELQDMGAVYGIAFDKQKAYLSKKIEALEAEVATAESLLAGNRDAARAANEAYGAADAEAASLAEGLPPSIGDIAYAQFEKKMEAYVARYREARESAVSADSVIREYFG